jgi:hypothetical protein
VRFPRPALGPHLDVTDNGLDGDPTLRLMPRQARSRFERGENDAKVVVLHERPGVLAGSPFGFAVELFEFSLQIKLQKWGAASGGAWGLLC